MKKQYTMTITAIALACFLAGCSTTNASTKQNATTTTSVAAEDLFTKRDLAQTADTKDAKSITLKSGSDVTITKAGIYVLTGVAKNTTVYVETEKTDKVQLVLDNVSITNESAPCIYVKSADKVFVTLTDKESSLTVSGAFSSESDANPDGVIFSKDDLVINGTGTLTVQSSKHGIVSKDDLKVTGGTINIQAQNKGLSANDSIAIGGGTLAITAKEGMEATQITVQDGKIDITASDDGINATQKSEESTPVFTLNGGTVTITMGAGDTDGVDSNGDIYINGGTISISGRSTFDYDGTAEYNGGTIIENGEETNTITNQMLGGPGGGQGGGPGGEPKDGDGPSGRPDGALKGGPKGGHGADSNSEQK
ncbi:protein of unknown function [Lachnospiraceae bacterium XBB1006]|nr:protein of unknown function [Lachnospiraceae bacterium XBB1006]